MKKSVRDKSPIRIFLIAGAFSVFSPCSFSGDAPYQWQANPTNALPVQYQSGGEPQSARGIFAGILAKVLSVTADSLVTKLSTGIVNWFNPESQQQQAATQANPMAAGNVVQQGLVDGQPATSSVNFNWPGGQGAWPSQASPGVTSAGDPFQVQNAGVPPVTQASSEGGVAKGIYAGFAYEVHKLAFGQSAPVDPANHIFRSGDQFVLYYRPTLPGRIEVYNINPQGLSFKVDESNVAAAQLVKLGPYQFTDPPGDESLRVVLFPCGSPELAMLTRNIVKVADMGGIQGVQLRECAMPSLQQNPVQTRNIQKVLVEGRTGFALDPLANSEVNSGVIAAREVAIRFNHR